jgi:hypothetical protein
MSALHAVIIEPAEHGTSLVNLFERSAALEPARLLRRSVGPYQAAEGGDAASPAIAVCMNSDFATHRALPPVGDRTIVGDGQTPRRCFALERVGRAAFTLERELSWTPKAGQVGTGKTLRDARD